jgi:hypothetical protein
MVMHLWSLCVEEQFYFAWPGILRKWYRHGLRSFRESSRLLLLYSAGCYYFKVQSGGYGTFPAVADNLAIGCLLAIFGSRIAQIRLWAAIPMVLAVLLIPSHPANTPIRTLFMLFVLWPILHCSIAGLVLHVIQSPYRILNLAPPCGWGESATAFTCGRNFFFQSHSAASVQTSSWHRAGLSFPLSSRTACTQIAGQQSSCSDKQVIRARDWFCAKLCSDLSVPFAPVVVT